jgi:hypothetical protein
MHQPDLGHQRIVIYWTLHSDTGHSLACELSRAERGLMVRCMDEGRKVILSERVGAAAAAGEIAAQWKMRLLQKGDYFERPRRVVQPSADAPLLGDPSGGPASRQRRSESNSSSD